MSLVTCEFNGTHKVPKARLINHYLSKCRAFVGLEYKLGTSKIDEPCVLLWV